MTTPDYRALCAELLQPLAEYDDANPYHEHRALIARARAALTQPEPEFTDDEVGMIQSPWSYLTPPQPEPEGATDLDAEFRSWYNDRYCRAYFGGIALAECIEWTQFVLARWGRPAIKSVPVSKQPWEREGWCDADGRCWWGRPSEELCNSDWFLATRAEVEEFCDCFPPVVSLPAHALPVPEVTP